MQSASDKEFSVMKQCLRLVSTVATPSGRKRVVDYLSDSLGEMVTQPKQEDPRQTKLPGLEEQLVAGIGSSAASMGEHP